MPLVLHCEGRLERLIDALGAVPGPSDPFVAERIVVATRAAGPPLLAALALRRGVAAHVETPTLEAFLGTIDDAIRGQPDGRGPASRDDLLHAVLRSALRLRGTPAFASLAALHGAADDAEVVDAALLVGARRLSAAFLRYARHRPALLTAWEAGEEPDDWQAMLWRAVRESVPGPVGAARWQALADALRKGPPPGGLGGPVRVFGHHGIGHAELDALEAMALHTEVHLFVQVPAPRPGPLRTLVQRLDPEGAALVHRLGPTAPTAAPDPAPPRSVLGALQGLLDGHPAATRPPADDDSIVLLPCRDPREQVERVRDVLLGLLDADPTLQPHDILIATPAIDRFAPWIEAIFEEPLPAPAGHPAPPSPRPPPHAPPRRRRSPRRRALGGALALAESRAEVDAVVRFLSRPLILEALELDEDALRRCRRWFDEAAIRWGRDAHHRAAVGQPAIRLHTWRHGFDRLLLGYALPDADPTAPDPFEQLAPVTGLDGSDAALLGRCMDLLIRLFDAFDEMRQPAPMSIWQDRLTALARHLVGAHPEASTYLQDTLGDLEDLPDTGAAALDLSAVRAAVGEALRAPRPLPSFQAGGVRITALAPGRAQPCRVMVLLGLDAGALTSPEPAAFDRLALAHEEEATPRAAATHVAFFEAILAPRDHLIATWGGPEDAREAPRAPAAPFEALLRELRREVPEAAWPRQRGAADVPSWTPTGASRGADEAHDPIRPTWPRGASLPQRAVEGGARGDIDLALMTSLLTTPHRTLLRDVLGFRLVRPEARGSQREPLSPDALDLYTIGERLTHLLLLGVEEARAHRILAAEGRLPPGHAGDAAHGRALPLSRALARAVAERIDEHAGAREHPFPVALARQRVDLGVAGRRVRGTIEGVLPPPPGELGLPLLRVAWRHGRLRVQDELRLWIEHLALTLALPRAPVSVFFGRSPDRRDGVGFVEFPPLPKALAYRDMAALVALHETHLERVSDFYPDTGRAFARAIARAREEARPVDLRPAEATWYTRNGWRDEARGDALDPDAIFLTAGARGPGYPFNSMDFRETSLRVFTLLGGFLRHGRR